MTRKTYCRASSVYRMNKPKLENSIYTVKTTIRNNCKGAAYKTYLNPKRRKIANGFAFTSEKTIGYKI